MFPWFRARWVFCSANLVSTQQRFIENLERVGDDGFFYKLPATSFFRSPNKKRVRADALRPVALERF
jgi:hypothetical protein